jgi:hypothetical protein
LPGFADCFGRWSFDGQEQTPLPNDENRPRGVFPLVISAGRFGYRLPEEYFEPQESHVTAYRILIEQHEVLADGVAEQLAASIRESGMGQFLAFDDEATFERLQKRDRILGTLWLGEVRLFTRSREGIAYAGFSFGTNVWDSEHGVGAVAWGNHFIGVGADDFSIEETFAAYQGMMVNR